MVEAINSGGDYGVRVFADLAVKAWVANSRLRLLVKLRFLAAVKELGGNGNRLSAIAARKCMFDLIAFAFHKANMPLIVKNVHKKGAAAHG